jgi:hypothetical protein
MPLDPIIRKTVMPPVQFIYQGESGANFGRFGRLNNGDIVHAEPEEALDLAKHSSFEPAPNQPEWIALREAHRAAGRIA